MKVKSLFLSLATALVAVSCSTKNPADYIDPFIGTDGVAHTFPGATTPFGMVQLSPDTGVKGWEHCSGYHSGDSTIMGFSHTHLSGTGWADLGDVLLIPSNEEPKINILNSKSDTVMAAKISHSPENESASAGYYSVNLIDRNIKAELTATPRVGVHRYTFNDSLGYINIDPLHKIFGKGVDTQIAFAGDSVLYGSVTSTGWGGNRKLYFYTVSSKPRVGHAFYINGERSTKTYEVINADDVKISLRFNTTPGEQITMFVAISPVSVDDAILNYKKEARSKNFDLIRSEAYDMWNKAVSKYEFKTTEEKKKILYTGLYHSMIHPNLWQDVTGSYYADGKAYPKTLQDSITFTNYSTFSFWDTFRAVHPLLTITESEKATDFANTLIQRHKDGSKLPLWELCGYDNMCMIGYPAVSVLADAIMKGLPVKNQEEALAAMIIAADSAYASSSDGHSGTEFYLANGYVPVGVHVSVSKTMENSYYDWCVFRVAEKFGHKATAARFYARSQNFLNHLDKKSGLMLPIDSAGVMLYPEMTSWDALKPHYISGNIWAYSYFFPHAVNKAVEAVGGKDKFIANLDGIFNTPINIKGEQHVDISGFIGGYGHGDEPGHQMPYLYGMVGETWKSAPIIKKVSEEFYNTSRKGMPNNDDCGQMSSWYIFSAMGFYPVCPGDNKFVIGAPQIEEAVIHTSSGKSFTMKAKGLSPENIYIESATLNGKPLTRGYITYDEIMYGSTLEFKMSSTPNKTLFTDK